MSYLVFKYLVTSGMIVLVSEIARKNDRLGAFIASLPLVTILTLIWLYVEKQPHSKISNHAYYTFWYVIPTLPMFILFPFIYVRVGFIPTVLLCITMTAIVFALFALILKHFGINLV